MKRKQQKPATAKRRHYRKMTALVCTLLLGGCQLTGQGQGPETNHSADNTGLAAANFSQYYLSLKQLNPGELLDEIERISQLQKQSKQQDKADVYLLLLKALPNSPIYNPYNAKDQLNRLPAELLSEKHLTVADLALISLLKDQLNEQLYAQARITALEQEKGLNQQEYSRQLNGLQSSLTELQQKLTQLKNIETAIDKHGQ